MDAYEKLRPPEPTQDEDICKCEGRPAMVLQSVGSCNPFSCADCNLEVDLRQLTLNADLVDEIASWSEFFLCFYNLWLDSGEYEDWARQQLILADSPVNKRALTLINKLASDNIDIYYWWFDDSSSIALLDDSINGYKKTERCPNCDGELTKRENKFNTETNICKRCRILIAE